MKNIIFFVTGLDSGGLENYLLRFLQIKGGGFKRIVVYCKGGKGGQLETAFKQIPNLEVKINSLGFYNLLKYIQLLRYLKGENFDTVCDFTGNFSGAVLAISKFANIEKRIAFYRSSSDRFKGSFFKNMYNKFVRRLVLIYSTSILSNSKTALNNYFSGIWRDDKRFLVVYNGIDLLSFSYGSKSLREEFKIPTRAFVVGHTGRFNEAKNHNTIIKVAEKLLTSNPDIYFIMCGNGVRDNLQNIVQEKRWSERIFLFNNRSDIASFLLTMDCYFFPSITEGQPNSLIEAMIMGTPFVASNIDPIKETVPGFLEKEYLVSPEDVDSAVSKILKIRDNREGYDKVLVQEWAIEQYNANTQFDLFYSQL
ncbi:glycosyltransferase [Sphingobacterium chuzhouense]|uniref:Glycosyltransferase n=1 Tax=Sphingobacterium chuzhouense TaxID=1742264 RepID=A0ABR7XXI5_9SPHI|nr:glycosyltransferase [Sphingobacterium chuzhouense]MBD1423773.1 glycosyltransferase [Sphingobacterium chuzhouense]